MLRSTRKLWRHETWLTRIEMVIYAVCGTGALVFLAVLALYGVLTGDWNFHAILWDVLLYSLASTWFDYLTWRRRALEAEKPLPTTRAADIARLVERESRRREATWMTRG